MPHPDHLRQILTARQLREWTHYSEIDPWGEDRADLRSAMQVWASLQPYSKKRLKLKDFLLRIEPRIPPTPEELRRKIVRANALMGGRIIQHGSNDLKT